MVKRAALTLLFLYILFALFGIGPTHAYEQPQFPSCLNPQGSVRASYDSGTHGIVGNSNSFSGKDTVYEQQNGNLVQCFCPDNGNGIQTNWLKASSLSEPEIQSFLADGWIEVQDGSLWGLEHARYLAKNNDFSCKGEVDSSTGSGGTGNSTLAAATQSVLGLAATGDAQVILLLFITGSLSFVLGLLIKRSEV